MSDETPVPKWCEKCGSFYCGHVVEIGGVTYFDSLREDIAGVAESMTHYAAAVNMHATATDNEIRRLWTDNAALRDDLHAVSNRLEALTNFVVSDPAEVAAKIVTDANRATLREVRDDG